MKLKGQVPPKHLYLRNYILHILDESHQESQKSVNNLPDFKEHFPGWKSIIVWMGCRLVGSRKFQARSSANCNRFWDSNQTRTMPTVGHLSHTARTTGRFKNFSLFLPVSLHCRYITSFCQNKIHNTPTSRHLQLALFTFPDLAWWRNDLLVCSVILTQQRGDLQRQSMYKSLSCGRIMTAELQQRLANVYWLLTRTRGCR